MEQPTFFTNKTNIHAPLAERMRPQNIDEVLGQRHLLAPGAPLQTMIANDAVVSMILWGPPGVGKTTVAHVIAQSTSAYFVRLNAIASGVKDIRAIVKDAQELQQEGKKTIVFIDEIHRFNKAQQDSLLPFVENGIITLIGATTENPSFEVNKALLSRARVFVLESLSVDDIITIITRTLPDEQRGLGKKKIRISDETVLYLAHISNGDPRTALNTLELAVITADKNDHGEIVLDQKSIEASIQKTHLLYDRAGEEHYNIISALHKSMRGHDANAALYWLGRMLEAGEDPLYIARRLIRFASEDIGIANSQALVQAIAAYQACHFLGMPECNVNLAQAVVYMALSKKSNALYTAYSAVQHDIAHDPNEPVPIHLRNAPTDLMKDLGYGADYKYTPDYAKNEDATQDFLPKNLKNKKYISF